MEKKELLKKEQVEKVLSPHPLSFMKLQALCIFMISWGVVVWWLVTLSSYAPSFSSNAWYPLILWGLVLMLVGVAAWLATVQLSIFLLYLAVFAGAIGLIFLNQWENETALFILVYSFAVSLIGFLIIEMYRRSHKYVLTNLRVIFKGGVLTKRERTIRYDKIADVDAKQGIIGQIFGFGTIIPVSQAGFGLGSDKTMAGGGVALGGKKAKLFGFVGGGKEVQTPISRSYYELHGVYPFKDIKHLFEELVESHVPTQYQKEQVEFHRQQVDIQKQMRDMMQKQVRGRPKGKAVKQTFDDEEQEPEEEIEEEDEEEVQPQSMMAKGKSKKHIDAFPAEQIDIQQQMKELLKKQKTVRAVEPEDEVDLDDDEEEDGAEIA